MILKSWQPLRVILCLKVLELFPLYIYISAFCVGISQSIFLHMVLSSKTVKYLYFNMKRSSQREGNIFWYSFYWYPGYDIKLHLMVRLQSWSLRHTHLLPLLSGLCRPSIVVPVRVPSMGQIEVFNLFLGIIIIINYLKPYRFIQVICIR